MAENRDFLGEFNKLRVETDGIRETLMSKTGFKAGILEEIMRELKSIRSEIKENREEMLQKMEEQKKELCEYFSEKLAGIRQPEILPIPITEAIVGEWKMINYENLKGYRQKTNKTFEVFSENLKYQKLDGKLMQTGGGYWILVEGGTLLDLKYLYVEDDHVKSILWDQSTVDRYIENGKLHVIQNCDGNVWKRIYEKI